MLSRFLKIIRIVWVLGLVTLLLSACSDEYSLFTDDFKLNNKWEETTIVNANFNTSDKIHMIRVNRGFAAGDFFDVQGVQDSIQYQPGDLKVYFHKLYKGDTIATYECYDTIVEKEEGDFFNTGKVLMHAFRDPNLIGSTVDDLEFLVEVKTPKGNSVWAVTNPVNKFRTAIPNPGWAEYGFHGQFLKVRFSAPINSQVFDARANIGFMEIGSALTNYDTTYHEFEVFIGRILEQNPTELASEKNIEVSTLSVYRKLSDYIQRNGDLENTSFRKFTGMTIEVVCGNADLAIAASSASTSSGFSDNLASYTNVINGLGNVSVYSVYRNRYGVNPYSVDSVKNRYPEYRFVH